MRKQIFCLIFAFGILMGGSSFSIAQASRTSVSSAEVNGTFKMNFKGKFKKFSNGVKILALGGGRIRFGMDLVYPYTLRNNEPMVNMGGLVDGASIEGDTANYESSDGKCKFLFKFVKSGTLRVTQESTDGECGFGHNVLATGTYVKVSGKKPTFEENL